MGEFVHLHLHSEYSILDGACRIKDIPKRVLECGHDAVAITDHGAMYGVFAFCKECVKNGIKPVIGCEVYVSPDSRFNKTNIRNRKPTHLVLLCKDVRGYKNLIEMVSKGFTEGFYSKPRIDYELLEKHSKGLIALSGCLAGPLSVEVSMGNRDGAVAIAKKLKNMFDEGDFYVEIQNHGLPEERQVYPELVKIAEECGIPIVATNDCHYLRREDAAIQDTLLRIQTNAADGEMKMGFSRDEFYYKTTDEMKLLFGKYGEAIENTVKIAEKCNFKFEYKGFLLPKFPFAKTTDHDELLKEMTYEGFLRRKDLGEIRSDENDETYPDRLKYELKVIKNMGYSDYFLIVQDYVNFAKSKDIPVGPGRGSAAGSLVAFCLGITDIDPIKFGLLFEMFLNPERTSMPDIDVDFCYNRRGEVIDYVTEKYGEAHVSQIITFGTLAARAAIRDTGRALGMPYSEVDKIAKMIPQEVNITIDESLTRQDLKSAYESDPDVKKLVDTARGLEGMPRNISVHAAGVVITDKELTEYVPLAVSNDVVVTQFDMDTISELGLLKFDFLGLRYLTVIDYAVKEIREKNPNFDLNGIPLDDKSTYDLLSSGNTLGVFQLESPGMRRMLMSLRPENIDDIFAAISLYRPGPMDSIPKYIENKHDPSKIRYAHPLLKPILAPTYGCIIYQEQVLSIFRDLAGYSYGHADIVRRAISKKKAEVMEAERINFMEGTKENGIDRETSDELFKIMSQFANYAFKKGHAAAYSIISYRTAYLKAHYELEYFAALLDSVIGNVNKMTQYIAELSEIGIEVVSPDINLSTAGFSVSDGKILFGLSALKNMGSSVATAIVAERKNGLFRSLEDFTERMYGGQMTKKQVEVLIASGAFDKLGIFRSKLMSAYQGIINAVQNKKEKNLEGQLDMFGMFDVRERKTKFEYPDIPEMSLREKLMAEKESAGIYFSGHLFDSYAESAKAAGARQIFEVKAGIENDTGEFHDGDKVTIAGIIVDIAIKTTKTDETMAFVTIEDKYSSVECIVFPNMYRACAGYLTENRAVCVTGRLQLREGDPPKILGSYMNEIRESATPGPAEAGKKKEPTESRRPGKIYIKVPDLNSKKYKKCLNLVEIFPGYDKVVFYDESARKYLEYGKRIMINDFVLKEICEIVGEKNAVYRQ